MRGHSCYEVGHRAHGGPPSPPTREYPGMKSRPNIKMILNCCSEALKPGSCQHIGHISLPCTGFSLVGDPHELFVPFITAVSSHKI